MQTLPVWHYFHFAGRIHKEMPCLGCISQSWERLKKEDINGRNCSVPSFSLLCVASCSPPAELSHAFRDLAPVQAGFKRWLGCGQMCSFSPHWHFVGLTFSAPSDVCLDQIKIRQAQSQREPRQMQACFQPQDFVTLKYFTGFIVAFGFESFPHLRCGNKL